MTSAECVDFRLRNHQHQFVELLHRRTYMPMFVLWALEQCLPYVAYDGHRQDFYMI